MLSFTATTGYAVQALGCLSTTRDRLVMSRQIAECTGIPPSYLSKVLNALVHSGLLEGKRGYQGGVRLTRDAADITLLELVEAVEGKDFLSGCFFGLEPCGVAQSCLQPLAASLRQQLVEGLARITVADMAHPGGEGRQRMRCCLPDGTVTQPRTCSAPDGSPTPCGCGRP